MLSKTESELSTFARRIHSTPAPIITSSPVRTKSLFRKFAAVAVGPDHFLPFSIEEREGRRERSEGESFTPERPKQPPAPSLCPQPFHPFCNKQVDGGRKATGGACPASTMMMAMQLSAHPRSVGRPGSVLLRGSCSSAFLSFFLSLSPPLLTEIEKLPSLALPLSRCSSTQADCPRRRRRRRR